MKYPPEVRQRVLELHDAGWRTVDIAAEVGVSASSVSSWARQAGRERASARTPAEVVASAVARVAAGEDTQAVADEVGVSVYQLGEWARYRGVYVGARPLTDAEHDRAAQLHAAGMSARGAAQVLGRSVGAVRSSWRRAGLPPPEYQRVDEEEAAAIEAAYAEVRSISKVAARFGRSVTTVHDVLHRRGAEVAERPPVHPDEVRQLAVELYEQGWSSIEVAAEVGVPHQRVSEWAKVAGVESRALRRWYSDGVRAEAVASYRAGVPAQEVADRLGCHWWTVVVWHREHH